MAERPATLGTPAVTPAFVPAWSTGEPLSAGDRSLLEAIAARVVRHGFGVPCVLFLEMTKPLSYVGSQTLVFFGPFVQAFLPTAAYDRFAALIEDRANVETLLVLIEQALEDQDAARRAARARTRQAARGNRRSSRRSRLAALVRSIVRRGARGEPHER